MNNKRVGIETYYNGKNIEISNNLLQLTDNVNISGELIVDSNAYLEGTLYAKKIIPLEFHQIDFDWVSDRIDL